MIDLYWTVIPVMLVHCFATHPASHFDFWRSRVALFLTWVWSIRLTHSYFRREKWQLGAREDWRFTEMSLQYGKHWWWISFFAVYLSQQVSKYWSTTLNLFRFYSWKTTALHLFDLLPQWLRAFENSGFFKTQNFQKVLIELHIFRWENNNLVGETKYFAGVSDWNLPAPLRCPLGSQAMEHLGFGCTSLLSFWHYCCLFCWHTTARIHEWKWEVERAWQACSPGLSRRGPVALLATPQLFRGAIVVVGTGHFLMELRLQLVICRGAN